MKKRYYNIQLLRFIFCVVIVNYHFYSIQLKHFDSLPNFFCRGYLADEFFFMVSGFFFCKTISGVQNKPIDNTVSYITKRIKNIAIPYYFSWILCFIGGRIQNILLGESTNTLDSLINSIYELTFLEMFGFVKGLYSNSLSWYFSALIISLSIICPVLIRFKDVFSLYVAPIIAFFLLGILSINFDYLYYPHKVLYGFVLKGMVRAFANVSLGIFMYSFVDKYKGKINIINNKALRLVNIIAWIIIIGYMIVPFDNNTEILSVQYDYIFLLIIFISLLYSFLTYDDRYSKITGNIFDWLGKVSVYIYFGQPIFYSLWRWFLSISIRTIYKYIIFWIAVMFFSFLVYIFEKIIMRLRKRRLSTINCIKE